MSTTKGPLAFGPHTLNHYSLKQDFFDWLEVLEFLGFLQALIFDAVPADVEEHDASRAKLAIVVGATIPVWRRAIEDAFLGELAVSRQMPRLWRTVWPLREAMKGMKLVAESAVSAMELADKQKFITPEVADEPRSVIHGRYCLV